MRRGPGLAAFQSTSPSTVEAYSSLSNEINKNSMEAVQAQLTTFRDHLQDFSVRHRARIEQDADLGRDFTKMCAILGVDPLVGSKKSSFWAEDRSWTYELAVQIITIFTATAHLNGGIMKMSELIKQLIDSRQTSTSAAAISRPDVVKAINALSKLGTGYRISKLSKESDSSEEEFVLSTPHELDQDQLALLSLAMKRTSQVLTVDEVMVHLDWTRQRADSALNKASNRDGMAWIDDGPAADYNDIPERRWWFHL